MSAMHEMQSIPRPEYPRPQMIRENWLNLNGTWQFEIDHGRSCRERGLQNTGGFGSSIVVPFCPESRLSGVEHKDFMNAVWYRREFTLPQDWMGSRVLLHFGAVDYDAEVWINSVSAGRHRGGYTSFSFEITKLLREGSNTLTVCAEGDVRSGLQPKGKQSGKYASHGCDYTRTTGIWQTVWLEKVPYTFVSSLRLTPDAENECVHIEAELDGMARGMRLEASASYEGSPVGDSYATTGGSCLRLTLKLSRVSLWEPGNPRLYDLDIKLSKNGGTVDRVLSYFGLRSISWDGNALRINGRPVFQRLVLDQGFYPEGIYTAPSDEDLKRDVEISMGMGFNGARLHQKIFEPRFLYWADKLGYLVWGEHASWGLDISGPMGLERFLPEWLEALKRDYSHPSIVGWCPFNETNGSQDANVLFTVYAATKQIDATRPVIDTSGYVHVVTDVFDVHDYDQNVENFRARYAPMAEGGPAFVVFPKMESWAGQPYFVSEYGGIWWNPGQAGGNAWGYGERPKSEREFLARYEGLTTALLDNPGVCAFCYTQLYDIEQEVNGLYTYDRRPKFDTEVIRRINSRKAAIEA